MNSCGRSAVSSPWMVSRYKGRRTVQEPGFDFLKLDAPSRDPRARPTSPKQSHRARVPEDGLKTIAQFLQHERRCEACRDRRRYSGIGVDKPAARRLEPVVRGAGRVQDSSGFSAPAGAAACSPGASAA